MSSSSSDNLSVAKISLAKTLEVCGQLAPPFDEDEKESLVFELPRQLYFMAFCRMFKNNVAFALVKDKAVLGVMGAFWDLTVLPGPKHFIYAVIDHKAASSTGLLFAEVKKYIASQGFSLQRVGFHFFPGIHDEKVRESLKLHGFIPGIKDHRMKLDLPCKFQPHPLGKDYSVEEVTKDTIFEHLATIKALTQAKPFSEAYRKVVSDPDFTTRPYNHSMTMCLTARHKEEPVGGMAICLIGKAAFVMNMIVSPKHRRLGIAQNMIKQASSIASKKGCETMLVSSADNTEALSLYGKVGFHEIGIIEGFAFQGN